MNRQSLLTSAVLAVSALVSSAPAWAQGYTYWGLGGPAVDINFVNNEPSMPRYCDDRYFNDGPALSACIFGVNEARRMAARYAGGWGKTHGYLRGYAWGLYKMIDLSSKNSVEEQRGSAAINSNEDPMTRGLQAGSAEGKTRGATLGEQDAIARFRAVLGQSRRANPSVTLPDEEYTPPANAYAQYVGEPKNEEQIIRELAKEVGELRVYEGWDTVFLGEKRPMNLRELFFDDGIYRFEKGDFYNKELAFKLWVNKRSILDANGVYQKYADARNKTPPERDLTPYFQEGFNYTYDYFVNYHYSSEFQKWLDVGTGHGATVGDQAGKRLAYQTGQVRAYNEKFNASAKGEFKKAFDIAYTQSFNATFADYNNNPKLSFKLTEVIGSKRQGITQPGEDFVVKFEVTNLGGVGGSFEVGVQDKPNQVIALTPQKFEIGPSITKSYETPQPLGKIDSRMNINTNAPIVLMVNQKAVATLDQPINRQVQIIGSSSDSNFNAGQGAVSIHLKNTSQVESGVVAARLVVGSSETDPVTTGSIGAGGQRNLSLPFKNLNPLDLISGKIKFEAVVTLDGAEIARQPVITKARDENASLASYFNAMAHSSGHVPSGYTPESQMGRVRNTILATNARDVERVKDTYNIYKLEPNTTILGQLVNYFVTQEQTQESKRHYYTLAAGLKNNASSLPKFLIWGKRKTYEKLLRKIEPPRN